MTPEELDELLRQAGLGQGNLVFPSTNPTPPPMQSEVVPQQVPPIPVGALTPQGGHLPRKQASAAEALRILQRAREARSVPSLEGAQPLPLAQQDFLGQGAGVAAPPSPQVTSLEGLEPLPLQEQDFLGQGASDVPNQLVGPSRPVTRRTRAEVRLPAEEAYQLEETQGPVDSPVEPNVVPLGGGRFAASIGEHVLEGTPQEIVDVMRSMANEPGGASGGDIANIIAAFPTATRGGARQPMLDVTQQMTQAVRGQPSLAQLQNLLGARDDRIVANKFLDEAQEGRFNAREKGLGELAGTVDQQAQEQALEQQQHQAILQNQMVNYQRVMDRVSRMQVDPDAFWGRGQERFGRMLGASIAVALSGLGAALSGGGENQALAQINRAIDRSVDTQRLNLENARASASAQGSALGQMRQLFQDEEAASAATRALHLQAAVSRIQQLETTAGGTYAGRLSALRQALEMERDAANQVAASSAVQATIRTTTQRRMPVTSVSQPATGVQPTAAVDAEPTVQAQPGFVEHRGPGGQAVRVENQDQPFGELEQTVNELIPPQRREQVRRQEAGRQAQRVLRGPVGGVTRQQRAAMLEEAREFGGFAAPPGFRTVDSVAYNAARGTPTGVTRIENLVSAIGSVTDMGPELARLTVASRSALTEPVVRQRMNALAGVMQNAIRVAREYQAPQAAELERMERAIPAAASPLEAIMDRAVEWLTGDSPRVESLRAQIDALNRDLGRRMSVYGLVPETPAAQTQQITRPRRATEVPTADDVRRRLSR